MATVFAAIALAGMLLVVHSMPRAVATPPTAKAVQAAASARNPYAGSRLYIGRDPGIRTAFRIRGRKVLLAKALMRLDCVGPGGRRHSSRVKKTFATSEAPLTIDRAGRFVMRPERDEEPGLVLERGIAGLVGSGLVVGSAFYYAAEEYRHLRCQTGARPRIGVKPTRLRFRAEPTG